jgi:hypothetical protein
LLLFSPRSQPKASWADGALPASLPQTAEWVFDCDAPLDDFGRRMRAALEARGWHLGPATVHDFTAARAGQRAYVKLVSHDWGVQVQAKLKAGWFGTTGAMQRALWESAREAQVGASSARAT